MSKFTDFAEISIRFSVLYTYKGKVYINVPNQIEWIDWYIFILNVLKGIFSKLKENKCCQRF